MTITIEKDGLQTEVIITKDIEDEKIFESFKIFYPDDEKISLNHIAQQFRNFIKNQLQRDKNRKLKEASVINDEDIFE